MLHGCRQSGLFISIIWIICYKQEKGLLQFCWAYNQWTRESQLLTTTLAPVMFTGVVLARKMHSNFTIRKAVPSMCVCVFLSFSEVVLKQSVTHISTARLWVSRIVIQQCGHSTNASVSAEILFASLRRSVPVDTMFIVSHKFRVSHQICWRL